jgi:hypothetical protein
MTEFVNALILVSVFLALVAGHFFPWHVLRWRLLIDERGNLNPVPAHTYGVACILAGFWAWAVVNRIDAVVVRALMAVIAAAGLGTIAPRGVRWLIERQARWADVENSGFREFNGSERSGRWGGRHGPTRRG